MTFTRSYLNGLAAIADKIVEEFIDELKGEAAVGNTSYIVDSSRYDQVGSVAVFITAFKAKFPGCHVYYHENWNCPESHDRILMKGICIDWT